MARMHSRKKGKSGSKRPSRIIKPEWCEYTAEQVEEMVIDLYKKGETPSNIGLILRDTYGIPLVRAITGKKIKAILDENELKSPLPEDFMNLAKKALNIRKHLEENKKDLEAKKGLNRVESKIYRLVRYYKKKGVLEPDFKYKPDKIKIMIR
ncbi:MAG: 30S ribosomal protein S15 [archaeon]|nr:30S ribosomal protein S15 [archaeon]